MDTMGLVNVYSIYLMCLNSLKPQKNSADYCCQNIHKMIAQSYARLKLAYKEVLKKLPSSSNCVMRSEPTDSQTEDNSSTADNINKLLGLSKAEIHDAMLTEASRASCEFTDRFLQATTQSGTTMSSIFFNFADSDDTVRVMCCNVGDSRSIMLICDDSEYKSLSDYSPRRAAVAVQSRPTNTPSRSSDLRTVIPASLADHSKGCHNISDNIAISSNIPINENQSSNVEEFVEPTALESSPRAEKVQSLNDLKLEEVHPMVQYTFPPQMDIVYENSTVSRSSKLVPLSEDHSLLLHRERYRIENKLSIPRYSLPIYSLISTSVSTGVVATSFEKPISPIETKDDFRYSLASNFIKMLVNEIRTQSEKDALFFTPDSSILDDESVKDTRSSINSLDNSINGRAISEGLNSLNTSENGLRSDNTSSKFEKSYHNKDNVRIMRQETFIARRRGQYGEIGTEAIFGRYNISVMMTRSLGDKYGPRSCRGIPDVRLVTLPVNRHARFIIASDGLWDVMTSDFIKCIAFLPKFADPQKFASYLARKAWKRRHRKGIRMDDITVVCVDLNANEKTVKYISSDAGEDTLVNGVSTYKPNLMDSCVGCISQ